MIGLLTALITVALTGVLAATVAGTGTPFAVAEVGNTPERGLRPWIIGHRGASGYLPEHTLASYELAARMGADYIEPDVVATLDHVLVARHENEISATTDVANRPEFAGRRTTRTIDGVPTTGWFTEDFTLAELRTLRAKERLPVVRQENTLYDGRWQIPTLNEVFELRERLSQQLGRTIGIIPETKHPTYFKNVGLPLEEPLVKLVRAFRLDRPTAPVMVQSFELNNLTELRERFSFAARLVLLTATSGKGFGDDQTYAELSAPPGLRKLRAWVSAIGPDKNQVIPRRADGSLSSPTSLVADAHAVGLKVLPYTFRAENMFLPTDLQVGTDPADFGEAIVEGVTYMRTGIDGLFCDQPDVCVQARYDLSRG